MDTIFNMFDAVVIGLILLLSLKGLISGFTKELFNALGIIGGLFTATFFNKEVAQYLNSNFNLGMNIKVLELISLIVIFIAVFLVMKIIYKIITSISNDDYISLTSRLSGMLIKIVTLFFIFSLIVFALSSKPQVTEKFKDTLANSRLYPLLKTTGAAILNAPELINSQTKDNIAKDNNKTNISSEDNNKSEINKKVENIEEKLSVDKNISTKEVDINATKNSEEKDSNNTQNSIDNNSSNIENNSSNELKDKNSSNE